MSNLNVTQALEEFAESLGAGGIHSLTDKQRSQAVMNHVLGRERNWPYVWIWGTCGGKYPKLGNRNGHPCRILAKGRGTSVLIQFEDGYKTRTSIMGLRKRK
jgi:hypothetical protein